LPPPAKPELRPLGQMGGLMARSMWGVSEGLHAVQSSPFLGRSCFQRAAAKKATPKEEGREKRAPNWWPLGGERAKSREK